MKRAVLGPEHDTMEKIYRRIATDLKLPAHFAPNLDALWDALLRDVEGPFEIAWPQAATDGPEFDALRTLLGELEKARADFTFKRR
jgi:RNAse (barnase) inhibitor barstar